MSNSYAVNSSNFEVINTNGNVYTQSPELEGTANSVNADVENFDLTGNVSSVEANDAANDDSSVYKNLTEEDIKALVGTMSKDEYDEFIAHYQEYYQNDIECLEALLNGANGYPGVKDVLAGTDNYLELYTQWEASITSHNQNVYDIWSGANYETLNIRDINGDSFTFDDYAGMSYEDFIKLSYKEQVECLVGMSYDEFMSLSDEEREEKLNNIDDSKYELEDPDKIYGFRRQRKDLVDKIIFDNNFSEQINQIVVERYGQYGISDIEEIEPLREQLNIKKVELNDAISMDKHKLASAKYDNLYFMKDYQEFTYKTEFTEEEIQKFKDEYIPSYDSSSYRTYKYSEYKQKHPEITEVGFALLVYQANGNSWDGLFVEMPNASYVQNMIDIYDSHPQFLKAYAYLEEKSYDETTTYSKSCEYQINQVLGQYAADEFLDGLSVDDDFMSELANELDVDVEGLKDGFASFVSGAGYTVEALLTLIGLSDENRTYSVSEYKKMYILQALMSEKDKADAGLIMVNKDSVNNNNINKYINVDPTSVIDYTKNYSAVFGSLSERYEIFQGIGNMLPSIAMSGLNPIAGTVALGFSAGGNSYHSAMVEGHGFAASLGYGIFNGVSESVTERILGGLPGLSEKEIKSFMDYFGAMGRETFQEGFQELTDIAYRRAMGEKISLEEGWADIKKSAKYGAITAGILNSPRLVKVIYSNKRAGKNVTGTDTTTGADLKADTDAAKVRLKEQGIDKLTAREVNLLIQNGDLDIEKLNIKSEYALEYLQTHPDLTMEQIHKIDNDYLAQRASENSDVKTESSVEQSEIQTPSVDANVQENTQADESTNVVEDLAISEVSLDTQTETEESQSRDVVEDVETTVADVSEVDTKQELKNRVEKLKNEVTVENMESVLEIAKDIPLKDLDQSTKTAIGDAFNVLSPADQDSVISDMDLSAAQRIIDCSPSSTKGYISERVFSIKGQQFGYSEQQLTDFRNLLQQDSIDWEYGNSKKSDNVDPNLPKNIQAKEKKRIAAANSKIESEITAKHLMAATVSLEVIAQKNEAGYYAKIDPITGQPMTLDQIIQYKMDGKISVKDANGRRKKVKPVPQKTYERINHSEYLPTADCFISDERVVQWAKEICPDARIQGVTTLQELADVLYNSAQSGNPITATFVTFQNAAEGANNIPKFGSYGHTSLTEGGPFCIPEAALQQYAKDYPDCCCFIDGEFKILDMKRFGDEVLSGVPLGDAGTYMIVTEVPLNGESLAIPSANNSTAYLDYFVPGGNLQSGGLEATQRPTSCRETGLRMEAKGYDEGVFKGNSTTGVDTDIKFKVTKLTEENASTEYARMAEQISVSEKSGVALDTETQAKVNDALDEWRAKINDPSLSDTAVLEMAAVSSELVIRMHIEEEQAIKLAKIYAEGMDAASTKYIGFFKNFREHAAAHSMNVAEYAVKIAKANPNIDTNLVMYAALCHDLGMAGGYYCTTDADGKMQFKKIDEIYGTENLTEAQSLEIALKARSNHPLNSALIILTNDVLPPGVDPSVAALLAMSHSKSTSGIRHISSQAEFNNCIDKLELALQTYNEDNGTNFTFDADKLRKMVADPDQLKILQDEVLAIRDGDAMSKVAYDATGNTIMQTGTVDNNNITTHRTSYDQDVDSPVGREDKKAFEKKLEKSVREELIAEGVKDVIVDENGNEIQLDPNDPNQAISMRIHTGENNVLFNSSYKDSGSGMTYKAEVTPVDANATPNCTFAAIEERLGEVITYDNCAKREFVIKLPKEAQGTAIGDFYEQQVLDYKNAQYNAAEKASNEAKLTGTDNSINLKVMEFCSGDATSGSIRIEYE